MASLFQKVERYKLPLRTSEEDAKEEGIRIEALHLKPITHNADGVDTALNATHGLVDFVLEKETEGQAKFAVISHEEAARSEKVIDLLIDGWQLNPPSVVLSVTGAAQELEIPKVLENAFTTGLAKAAESLQAGSDGGQEDREAWVITGGTDAGVMAHVGKAMMQVAAASRRCIGIAPKRQVMYEHKFTRPLQSQKKEMKKHLQRHGDVECDSYRDVKYTPRNSARNSAQFSEPQLASGTGRRRRTRARRRRSSRTTPTSSSSTTRR